MGGELREWRDCKLGDVLELKRGYDLPSQQRQPGSVPIVSSSGPSGFHSEAMVKAPGVVTGRYGTLGEVFFVTRDFWPLNTTLYVRDFKGSDPKFISYFLKTIDFYSCSDKAAVPGVNRNHLHELPVRVPPLADQHAIARILGTLDEKIELNRKMNATLEAMAQALFKSWFVDFDPVRANAEGRTPTAMDAETAKLFPSDFVDSELGPIPEGWRVGSVYELSTVDYGAPYTSTKFNTEKRGLPVVRIRDLVDQTPAIWTDEEHPRAVRLADGDVVVGMDGEFRTHVWGSGPALLNQRACRFSPRDPKDGTFVRLSVRPCLEFVERTEVATTVIHLGKSDIDRFRVVIPSRAVLDVFAIAAGPLVEKQIAARHESRSLARIRDALLPRLLSGELSVADAELVGGTS